MRLYECRLAQSAAAISANVSRNPSYDVRPITVRPARAEPMVCERGTVFRCALDALRAPGKTLSRREIAMLAAKSVTDAPPKAVRGFILGGRVNSAQKLSKS